MSLVRLTPDTQWAAGLVASLPPVWERRLLKKWADLRGVVNERQAQAARFRSNVFLRRVTDALNAVRIPLDAGDSQICDAAEKQAIKCMQLACVYHTLQDLHAACVRVCEGQGVKAPAKKSKAQDEKEWQAGAVARMCCPIWWRRKLRSHQGQVVENAAVQLGYIHKRAEIYCSDQALWRRQQQNDRNAAMLEATIARNELGQEYTLAELAAKGTANKAIRRAELMTRIAGFERVALDCAHAGLFATITCPSRMHAWRTVGGWKVEPNPKYDQSTPRQAQQYLGKVWARIRAKLARKGIGIYGFRIAEPQHDGTPHWHCLFFYDPKHDAYIRGAILEHALRDSPNEPGAHAHRVDFEAIDWSKGGAAAYIAKYVAKNIDGYRVEKDLHGNDALETSARVEAWARTWGIRQFQQVGGPPVGVWRELRRVEALPAGAPAHLVKAHNAVNKVAVFEGREQASVAWHHYCEAQGGVFVGRNAAIQLDKIDQEGLNRYGEEKQKRTIGVCTTGIEYVTPEWMAHMPAAQGCMARHVLWEVESKRMQWEIVGKRVGRFGGSGGKLDESHAQQARGAMKNEQKTVADGVAGLGVRFDSVPVRVGGELVLGSARRAPWTCVNNCTEVGNGASETSTRSVEQGPFARQSGGRGIHGAGAGCTGRAGEWAAAVQEPELLQ